MESSDREVKLERVARAIARVIALKSIQDDKALRALPFSKRLTVARDMANDMWRDLLMEAEAAMDAYPDPVEVTVQ